MRVCLVTENYNPKYGGQYTAVKNVVNICKSIKIKNLIIMKYLLNVLYSLNGKVVLNSIMKRI